MQIFGKGLVYLGRRGPELLVLALLVGAAAPDVSQVLAPALPIAAFFLTLGSFLSAGLATPEALQRRLAMAGLVWIVAVFPALSMLALEQAKIDQAVSFGVLLASLAPPIGSAAAIATMLGMCPRLALILSVVPTLAAPVSIPLFLSLLGSGVHLEMAALILRLSAIVGAAAAITVICVRWRRWSAVVVPDSRAAAGLSVIGLVLVGILAAAHSRALFERDPDGFTLMILAACAVNLVGCVAGGLAFSLWGRRQAMTMALVTGNRNVTLAWAIAGAALPTAAEGFVVAAVIPILALPLVLKLTMAAARLGVWRRRQA